MIDKSKGKWCDDAPELDDIAYKLYIEYWNEFFGDNVTNDVYLPQSDFIEDQQEVKIYTHYYNNAKIILRTNKINKILKNG